MATRHRTAKALITDLTLDYLEADLAALPADAPAGVCASVGGCLVAAAIARAFPRARARVEVDSAGGSVAVLPARPARGREATTIPLSTDLDVLASRFDELGVPGQAISATACLALVRGLLATREAGGTLRR